MAQTLHSVKLTWRKVYFKLYTMSSTKIETRQQILATTMRLMEENNGKDVRMSDIAKKAGVSRQAVYLHFKSRTALMVATVQYVDEIKNVEERLLEWEMAPDGVTKLDAYIDFWGNYIPEIFGIAKALLMMKEVDEAAAAAWDNRMNGLKSRCRTTLQMLQAENKLSAEWTVEEATELFWMLISVQNWELLRIELDWSNAKYIQHMQTLVRKLFLSS